MENVFKELHINELENFILEIKFTIKNEKIMLLGLLLTTVSFAIFCAITLKIEWDLTYFLLELVTIIFVCMFIVYIVLDIRKLNKFLIERETSLKNLKETR